MGIVFRQSAKTSIIVFTGAALGAYILWLSTKYIPDKHEFGLIQNLPVNAVILSQVMLMGLNTTLAVYIHRFAADAAKRKLLITFCLFIPLLVTAIATLVYFLLRTWLIGHYQAVDIPIMEQYLNLLPVFTLLIVYQVMLEQYLGSQMKVAVSAFMREVVLRIVNIAVILLYAFHYIDFHAFVLGTVLMYFVPVFIFFILSLNTKAFGISFHFRSFSNADYKEIAHFSWYHFLLTASIIIMSLMDMVLLPFYDHNGLGSLAVYRVAVFLSVILQLPSKAFTSASFTVLAQAYAENDLKKARDIFARSSLNILIPSVCVAILLCCNLQNVVSVINNGYSEIIPVFLILFFGRMVDIATGMNDLVLSIANYYKFNFYLSLFMIAFLFIMIKVFVPHYGMYGAAWSTTASLVIFNLVKYFFVWKKLDMQPFSGNTVLVLICGLPALAGGYFFPYLFNPARHVYVHTFLDAAMRSSIIVVIYMVMLWWLKPSPDLSEYIASIKKNKRLF